MPIAESLHFAAVGGRHYLLQDIYANRIGFNRVPFEPRAVLTGDRNCRLPFVDTRHPTSSSDAMVAFTLEQT